ncbi:HD domain-containing protein [bacterium]|nr:HD domain-containing protein [bacterium]
MLLADPVYKGNDKKGALLLAANTLITSEQIIHRLAAYGIDTVKVDQEKGFNQLEVKKKKILVKQALEISASESVISNTLLDQRKWEDIISESKDKGAAAAIITKHTNSFISSVTNVFSKNITSRALMRDENILAIIKDIIHFVANHIDILRAVIRLDTLNEYTFPHSVNTMVLCLSLARSLAYRDEDIKRLGLAVILGDLGMANYHTKLTLRPSGLSKKEIYEINRHPEFTVEFLVNNGLDDQLINTLILEHHERYNGSGYPNELAGDEMHPLSKLFTIADVYDAMTSPRPYRTAIPPFLALREIHGMADTLFDPKMATYFIKHLGVFPMGSMVDLSGGRPALVAGMNKEDPLKPLVIVFNYKKILNTSEKIRPEEGVILDPSNWELVDLAVDKDENYGKIVRGVDHRKFRFNPSFYLNQV